MSQENTITAYQELKFSPTDVFAGPDIFHTVEVNKIIIKVPLNTGFEFVRLIQKASETGCPKCIKWYDPNGLIMSSNIIWAQNINNNTACPHDQVELYIPLTHEQIYQMFPIEDVDIFNY